jgi:MOSC domain-containing protein YiiM
MEVSDVTGFRVKNVKDGIKRVEPPREERKQDVREDGRGWRLRVVEEGMVVIGANVEMMRDMMEDVLVF